ncbi:MAG: hypothetical protein IJP77_07530 [Bacteroidales bacterium]|jgi:hypothetical protein|nr:hypothetical protein [Bacteroidales bacterium]
MKRILLLTACWLLALPALAQIDAYTTWPYYYPDFQQGTLTLSNGQTRVMPINIHLLKGDLHFVDEKGIIQMAPAGQFSAVQIGEDVFRRVNGYLMKITPGPDDKNFVAVRSLADLTALNETGGAYGVSSTTSSTQRITSVDMPGFVNTSHMEQFQHRESGKKLKIKKEFYVVVDGQAIKASKKEVTEAFGADRADAFKQFLKKNKINWKDEQSLLKLFDFLAQ